MGTCADWICADDLIIDNVEIVVDLFRCAIRAKVKSDATVALGELEAMRVLRIDWVDTGHDAAQWPIAQVQAVATVAVHLHQLGRLVVMEEDLAELRVSFFAYSMKVLVSFPVCRLCDLLPGGARVEPRATLTKHESFIFSCFSFFTRIKSVSVCE